MLASSLWN